MIMDAGIKKEIEQNREILSPIIDSVIFCGRLGLPLRGHRDDSKYHPTVGCYSSGGAGNFIETLNYGVRRGDKVLENHLKNCETNSKKTRLTDICKTRWVERIEGLDTFQELFVPVYTTLNDMSENLDGEFKPSLQSDASSLFQLIDRFDFVVALVITRNILDSALPVTQLLQGKSIDIMDGIHLISTLKTEVVNMRNSSDFYHDTWYDEALELAAKVGIEEWKPRTVRKQTTRENIPHTTISEYYKRAITLPLLDHLQSSLESRFDLESVNVYKGLSIVPMKMMSMTRDGVDWKEPFKTVANFYYDDLPNPLALDAELRLWYTYWETHCGLLPDNIAQTLKSVHFAGFENIKILLRILGTLPITSCECERSISSLRTLKNYQRSTMVGERLNGLALMQIHQEIVPDIGEVINTFAVGNTRLKFA
ncbi:52 kDa repressor of the inhibitor of the protein kinase-like [Xenia sp. Carnegie-2017]|uniref:52 kDa repressor of the inhibitor of the protein kinase-like n=1 Tax=Xenia sp. Carnegie-2017 TaxID=2897299 RepID=UPI001F03BB80|nr:52 kDa repressor of the inhibitor of the protein kinase-like [Xenia sp. Carnegie-2017]